LWQYFCGPFASSLKPVVNHKGRPGTSFRKAIHVLDEVYFSILNLPVAATDNLPARLGYFDPPESQPYRQLDWSDVNKPEAQALARRAAVEGLVLMKNDGLLPLSPDGKIVAVIGPYTNATTTMQGNYFGNAPFIVTPFQGAQEAGFKVISAAGTTVNGTSSAGFVEAIHIAKLADIVVFAGGIDNTLEREGLDRNTISWPGNQLDLVENLASLGKPLIVVQFGGGQVDDTEILANEDVRNVSISRNLTTEKVYTGSSNNLGRLPRPEWWNGNF
jgi:hypothetical protein